MSSTVTTTTASNAPDSANPVDSNPPVMVPPHAQKTRILIVFGLLGFIFGVLVMFSPSSKYHDFVFHPRQVARTLLTRKMDSLFPKRPDPDTILAALNIIRRIHHHDENDLDLDTAHPLKPFLYPRAGQRRKYADIILYLMLEREKHRVEDIVDTSLNGRYLVGSLFTTNKSKIAALFEGDDLSDAARTFTFRYDRDTAYPELCVHAEGPVTIDTALYAADDIRFFKKYPSFGTFTVLTIFQFVAFFIVIPLGIGTIIRIKDDWKCWHPGKSSRFFNRIMAIDYSISFAVVAIFAALIFAFIVKPDFIGDNYFRSGLGKIVTVYYILAYIAAIVCYAGYLFTARIMGDMLVMFKSKAKTQQKNIMRDNKAQMASDGSDLADLTNRYTTLHSHFNIFFYTSAFLLSMTIVGSGSLFSAINSLDLVKFLNVPPAFSLLQNDFVYLLGALYTILLLLFYVPVKISMTNLASEIPDLKTAGSDAGNSNANAWLPVFSTGLRTALGVLAASSPFLISILQNILSSFGSR